MKITVAVGNIKANPRMSDSEVTHDIAILASMKANVTVGAEIDYPYSKKRWRKTFKAAGRKTYNLHCECPISTNLPVENSVVTRLHSGLARITPARFNSEVRLKGEPKVLIIGKHPVSGAWRKRYTFGQKIRQKLYGTDMEITQRRINKALRHGRSVVIAGDLNKITPPQYHPKQVVVAHAGLIQIIVVPAPGVDLENGREHKINTTNLYTDHPFLMVQLTFTEEARGA